MIKKSYFRYLGYAMWILPNMWCIGTFFPIIRVFSYVLAFCMYFAVAEFLTKLSDTDIKK